MKIDHKCWTSALTVTLCLSTLLAVFSFHLCLHRHTSRINDDKALFSMCCCTPTDSVLKLVAPIKNRVAAPSADAGPLNSTSCNALRDQGGVGPSGLQRRDLHVRLNLGFNFSPCVRQLASVMFRSSGTLRLKTLLCSTLNPSWIASASSRFTCKCQLLSSFHLIKLMWFLLAQACPLPHVGNGRPVPPLARSRIPPLKMSRFYEQADYTLKSIGKRSSSRSSAINSPDLAMQQHLNAFLYHRVSGPPNQAR